MNPYQHLQTELQAWLPTLGKAADTILDQEVSKYPLFVVYKGDVAIGLPLVERENEEWSINASTLEEFATKGLIQADKLENFQEIYKDPLEFICLFVVDKQGATFIFFPRK